jgi:hypothetical protein
MRGPCACPGGSAIRRSSVRQDGHTPTRTSTRPLPFPTSAPCPYRTAGTRTSHEPHSPIRLSKIIRMGQRALLHSVGKVHQASGSIAQTLRCAQGDRPRFSVIKNRMVHQPANSLTNSITPCLSFSFRDSFFHWIALLLPSWITAIQRTRHVALFAQQRCGPFATRLPTMMHIAIGCAITFCNQRDEAQHSHEIRSREQKSEVYPKNTIWQRNSTRTGSLCCYSKISTPLTPIQTATQMRKQAESIPVRCSTMG